MAIIMSPHRRDRHIEGMDLDVEMLPEDDEFWDPVAPPMKEWFLTKTWSKVVRPLREDTLCLVSQEMISNGEEYVICSYCKSGVVSLESMQEWFHRGKTSCIHCRAEWKNQDCVIYVNTGNLGS